MVVIASSENDKKKRIYHKYGCIYTKRIKADNWLQLDKELAESRHYRECKYCAGLAGDVKVHKGKFKRLSASKKAYFTYKKDTDTLYIQTDVGFWKIYTQKNSGKYILFHRNTYQHNINFNTANWGAFHRQADVEQTDSLDKIVDYIVRHDKAKIIIQDDYRKLPRRTKKQRKYFKSAERKAKRKEMQRLDYLFAAIAQA